MNKKGVYLKNVFDVFEVIFSLICIIILTTCFRLTVSNARYLLLFIDVYVIFSLYKILSKFKDKKIEERVVRYSKGKIESKFIEKVKF